MPGFKQFTDQQILTADNFMDFLMKQSVIVCDTSSDRDTLLATHVRQGMTCYVKNLDQMFWYSGSAWTRIATLAEVSASYNPRNSYLRSFMGNPHVLTVEY